GEDPDGQEQIAHRGDPLLEHQSACSGLALDVPQRLRGADRVVVGTIRRTEALMQTNAFGDRIIVTRAYVEVEETMRGDQDDSAIVEVEGGTLDGITLRVSSLPLLQAGRRAVFSLKRVPTDPHAWADSTATFVPHQRGLGIMDLGSDDRLKGSLV